MAAEKLESNKTSVLQRLPKMSPSPFTLSDTTPSRRFLKITCADLTGLVLGMLSMCDVHVHIIMHASTETKGMQLLYILAIRLIIRPQ